MLAHVGLDDMSYSTLDEVDLVDLDVFVSDASIDAMDDANGEAHAMVRPSAPLAVTPPPPRAQAAQRVVRRREIPKDEIVRQRDQVARLEKQLIGWRALWMQTSRTSPTPQHSSYNCWK